MYNRRFLIFQLLVLACLFLFWVGVIYITVHFMRKYW